jgi:uncharacterized membrane protein YfcA
VYKLGKPLLKDIIAHIKKAKENTLEAIVNKSISEVPFDFKILNNKKALMKAIPLFFIIGFLSNFLGIGGGVFNTPLLHTVFQFPIHFATAESTSILFVNSIYNFIIFAIRGQVDYVIGISIGSGMVIGSYIGASIAPKIPKHYILLILIGLIVYTIIQILTNIF